MGKNIKIGIIETALHVEVLRNYALIFSGLKIEVHAVLKPGTDKMMKSISKMPNLHWHFLGDPDLLEILDQCTILIFTTLNNDIHPFLPLTPRKYAVIHAFHRHFAPWKNYDYHIRPIRSVINLFRYLRFPTLPLKAMDGFIAGAPTVFNYLAQQDFFQKDRFYTFPFYVNESIATKELSEGAPFKIVVPGSVHPASRDYNMLYDIITRLKKPDRPVEIILAGKASGRLGEKIVQKMEALKKGNIKIRCFKEYLTAEEYQEAIEQADVLLCPIPSSLVIGFSIEKNSHSQVSGNINDFVNKGKPVILPTYYQLEAGLESAVMRYQNQEDLKILLESLISGSRLIADHSSVFTSFNVEARIKIFQKELDRLLNT